MIAVVVIIIIPWYTGGHVVDVNSIFLSGFFSVQTHFFSKIELLIDHVSSLSVRPDEEPVTAE